MLNCLLLLSHLNVCNQAAQKRPIGNAIVTMLRRHGIMSAIDLDLDLNLDVDYKVAKQ